MRKALLAAGIAAAPVLSTQIATAADHEDGGDKSRRTEQQAP